MRRLLVAMVVASFVLVPATGAGADCPALTGSAKLDFGRTLTGKAKLEYDGAKIKVGFAETAFPPPEFDFFFPGGTVHVVETATLTPLSGPLVAFDSTIAVTSGGSGSWTWSGVANLTAGIAQIQTIEGTLCIDS